MKVKTLVAASAMVLLLTSTITDAKDPTTFREMGGDMQALKKIGRSK